MLAKLGFFLVIALFGVLMFAAGTMAPENYREPVRVITQKVTALITPLIKSASIEVSAKPVVPADVAPKPEPVSAQALLLPILLPDKAQFALQVSQFSNADEADGLSKRIKTLNHPSTVIPIVDQNNQHWFVVSAGTFKSAEDAWATRGAIARDLGMTETFASVLLPAPPAAAPAPVIAAPVVPAKP